MLVGFEFTTSFIWSARRGFALAPTFRLTTVSLIILARPSVGGVDHLCLCLVPASLTLNVIRKFERSSALARSNFMVNPLAGAAVM